MDAEKLLMIVVIVFVIAFAIMAVNIMRSLPKQKRQPRRRRSIASEAAAQDMARGLLEEAIKCTKEEVGEYSQNPEEFEEKFREACEQRRDFYRKRVTSLLYHCFDDEADSQFEAIRNSDNNK